MSISKIFKIVALAMLLAGSTCVLTQCTKAPEENQDPGNDNPGSDPGDNPGGDNPGDNPGGSEGGLYSGNYYAIPGKIEGEVPKVYIETKNHAGIYSKEDYVEGTITIKDPDHKFWETEEFTASMGIRGRGNTTWDMPKKPYKIKLDEKANLFNFSNDKTWCILANYADKSLLRNRTTMEISRRLGFAWTPRMVPVEVYLNGSYIGAYDFCEHKKVSKQRVNIDVDGGDAYFELETRLDQPVSWSTEMGMPIMFTDPEYPSAELEAETKAFFKELEDRFRAGEYEYIYENMIEMDSFIDYYIIQEITKNIDGNLKKSTFMTRPKNGKLRMHHIWDFDIALGNCDYYDDGLNPWEGWWTRIRGRGGKADGWIVWLFKDPVFKAKAKARWKQVYPWLETIPDYIREQQEMLGGAPARNFKTWSILGYYVWPNYKVPGTYQGEVDWLIEYFEKRLAWMDAEIAKD